MCFKACVIRSMGTYQLLSKYPSPAFVLSILVSFLFLLSFKHVSLITEEEQMRWYKLEDLFVEVKSSMK